MSPPRLNHFNKLQNIPEEGPLFTRKGSNEFSNKPLERVITPAKCLGATILEKQYDESGKLIKSIKYLQG